MPIMSGIKINRRRGAAGPALGRTTRPLKIICANKNDKKINGLKVVKIEKVDRGACLGTAIETFPHANMENTSDMKKHSRGDHIYQNIFI